MSLQVYNSATDTLTPIAENDYKDSLEKISALPTASADLLNKCYLLTANQGSYTKGNIYQCQSDGSSGYAWILINSSGGSIAVDVVEDGNMNAVTSNAVADKFETLGTASEKDFTRFVSPTDSGLPISSSVFSAITSALYGAYHPSGSKTIAELDSSLLIQANVGNVYKITDSGVTTNLFIGGAGQTINVGDNAVVVYDSDGETFKYDLQSGVVDLSEYQTKELPSGAMIEDIVPTNASASNKLVTTNGKADRISTTHWISDNFNNAIPTDGASFEVFTVLNSASNTPKTGANYIVTAIAFQSGIIQQEAVQNGTNDRYIRYLDNGTWSSWEKLVTESNAIFSKQNVVGKAMCKYATVDGSNEFTNNVGRRFNGGWATVTNPTISKQWPVNGVTDGKYLYATWDAWLDLFADVTNDHLYARVKYDGSAVANGWRQIF